MSTPLSSESDNQTSTTPEKDKLTEERANTTPPDLPLASSIPSWDLLPSHTLLVRRKPVRR